jgi:hypothetical protein
VAVEISPEPEPDEREALLAALAQLDGEQSIRSRWWETGVREAVEDEPDGL